VSAQEEPLRALPAWTYRSAPFFRAEQEGIFRGAWLLVAHVSQLSRPGDYVSQTVAGEPIAVVRGDDGQLRAFSNVCRHRASRVLDGHGNCGKAMRCPYHGWTYGLDGRLLGVPERTGFRGLDKDANGLWPLACEVSAGFVFASLAAEPEPLDAYLSGFADRIAPYRPESLVEYARGEDVLPLNWKNVVDNYLEGYHIPVGHPGLLRLLDYKRYTVETTSGKASFARSPLRDKASRNWQERLYQRLVRPMPGLTTDEADTWSYIFVFPGMTWNLYPDQIDSWCVYPLDERRTLAAWRAYRPPDRMGARDRLVRRLNFRLNSLVMDEDNELCARVQDGLGSSLYRAGVLNAARENGLKHFHDLIREAVPAALLADEHDGLDALGAREAGVRVR
jgi:phenylpropionate dioxygenase-like ring-hydroxylating dioxygenase large terminal subunit